MVGERRATFLAESRQHVEHARGQEFLTYFSEHQHAQRRILCGLQDERVAGAKRGADLESSQQDRRVPRDDGADNAERLTPRVAQNMLAEGDRFALEFAAQAAEVADDLDCGLCLRACLGAKRVPGLERNRARQLLDPRLKRIGNPREKAPALARNRARPGGKGIGRSLHCARDVLGAPSGDLGDRAPVGRILDLEHLT